VAWLGQLLLPPACLVCGEAGRAGRDLCDACVEELPWNRPACARCALPLAHPADACGACLAAPPPFVAALAPLRYESPVDWLATRLKFHAGLAAGAVLAQLVLASARRPPVDCLVPVPLHRTRLGQRGYNQALELARPLARAWRLPVAPGALRRVRATAAQSELTAVERRRNLRGAFAADAAQVRGKRVLLVDDVITTGSTASEATRTLLAAGAAEVRVLAAARVG
jgi:ComF family protein